MNDLEQTISYFKDKQANCIAQYGQEEPHVADALEALKLYERLAHDLDEIIYDKVLEKFTEFVSKDLATVKPIDTSSGVVCKFSK